MNKEGIRSRLFDSVEAALRLADGYLIVDTMDDNELLYSEHYSCPVCGFTVPELEPVSYTHLDVYKRQYQLRYVMSAIDVCACTWVSNES